jgi:protein-disulfide isomerase/uncharacterized membrane protein YphA (DoxX/SURF4 family)
VPSRWAILRPFVATAARLLLAAVWLYAGLSKLSDPGQFLVAVNAYQLLPDWIARAVAYGLPVFEIGLGLLLLAGLATRIAATISAGLLVVFLIGVISAAARGLSIDCGCFGGGGAVGAGQTRYGLEIARDTGLLIVSAFLVWWPVSRYSADEAVRDSMAGPAIAPPSRHTKAARERVEALRVQQAQRLRQRGQLITAACLVVLLAAAGIGIAVQSHRNQPKQTVAEVNYTGPVSPAGTDGIVIGYPDAKVTIDLYEDFMCPVCGLFEQRSGGDVLKLVVDHKAKVAFHMVNFLDDASKGTKYSTRAANAAACAADEGLPFVKLHALLYAQANQPKENSTGLSDDQLIDYGVQAGADRAKLGACVRAGTHLDWPTQTYEAIANDPAFQGTPWVRVAGQDVDWRDSQAIIDAVNTATGTP